jgi:hypothetical protein
MLGHSTQAGDPRAEHALGRFARSASERATYLVRRTRRASSAGVDPRRTEHAQALLGCAVRGVDPTPFDGSSTR